MNALLLVCLVFEVMYGIGFLLVPGLLMGPITHEAGTDYEMTLPLIFLSVHDSIKWSIN
jgi:hypothetical protein